MKKNYSNKLLKLRHVLGCALLFASSHAFAQNAPWVVYSANEMPDQTENNKFVTASVTPSDPVIVATEQSIIDDPGVAGNKLLSFKINGNPHTSFLWRQNFPTSPASPTAATVVVRAKGLDGFDRAFEIDLDFNGYRETVYIINNTATSTAKVTFNVGRTAEASLENLSLGDNFNTLEWHTYRFTKDGATVKLFIDESETPVATSSVPSGTVRNYFRIGDGSSGASNGSYIDYMMWTTEGAYSPSQKSLPSGTLTKLKSQDAASARFSVYPNPSQNGQAKLNFHLQATADVTIQLYDLAGRKIGQTLQLSSLKAGQNEINLPVADLKQGTYLCQLSTNRFAVTQKLFIK